MVIGYLLVSLPASASDPIQAIQARYQSISDFKAEFVQSTYVKLLESEVEEKGVLISKRPGRVRIEYEGANPRVYVTNGKRIWIRDNITGYVETYRVTDNTLPREALEFLNGFGQIEKSFIVKEGNEAMGQGVAAFRPRESNTYLILIPKRRGIQFTRLDCEFGPDNLLKTMVIHTASGNVSKYTIESIKVNLGVADDMFMISN